MIMIPLGNAAGWRHSGHQTSGPGNTQYGQGIYTFQSLCWLGPQT
jgi:hypothetical protein